MLTNIKLSDLRLKKKLGKGAFGEVFESTIAGSKIIYATKKLDKSRYMKNPKSYKYLLNEINILKNINHENIVKLYWDLEDRKFRYLVTEYCNGGDLESCLDHYVSEKERPFSEEEVQYIMRQLVSGIKYLHSKTETKESILHRDLKLENILLHYDNEDDRLHKRILKAKVKIIDFGFARYLNDDEMSISILGSPMFMDPRILYKLNKIENNDFSYEQKADIYSLGVICYHLLTGHSLYDARNMEDLVKLTQKGIFKISADISKETVSFLNYMLRYDPKKRLDINQLSKHKFIVNDVKNFQKIDKNQLGNILDGSKLVIDLKKTYIDFLKESMFPEKEEEEEDEFTENWRLKLKEAEIKGNKIKRIHEEEKDIEQRPIKNIEKFIWEAIDKINSDSMSFEPKLIPFIPGVNKNILLQKD
jgi:calcium-dependent protein kinase